jgi:serine/threonine protein kinase
MNDLLQVDKADAAPGRPEVGQGPEFWLDQFAAACQYDESTTALVFAALHPEVAADAHLLAMLGYEEYCRRSLAGEYVDEEAFCAQFPDGGRLVRGCIETHFALQASTFLPGLEKLPAASIDELVDLARINWPAPGDTVSGFKLLEVLGSGGFARVYLAEELTLGRRRVVVKMSPCGASEAHTLGKLRHANIVPVHSVKFDGHRGLTLTCMPYLGRVTLEHVLSRLVRRGGIPRLGRELLAALEDPTSTGARLSENSPWTDLPRPSGPNDGLGRPPHGPTSSLAASVRTAAETPPLDPQIANASYVDAVMHLWAQLADALDYTNLLRICHRDIKPSNVLLDAGGKPMLLDFNLSFHRPAASPQLAGTLRYMAPELVRMVAEGSQEFDEIDPRSDLYSLAVIAFEMLSGEHPFGELLPKKVSHAAARELYARQQCPPQNLWQRNRDVDPALLALIESCLSFDPAARPPTAFEVAQRLRCLTSRPLRVGRWVWRRRRLAAAALLAFTGTAAAGTYSLATLPPAAERHFLAAVQSRQQGDFAAALLRLDAAETYGYEAGQIDGLRGDLHYQVAKQAYLAGEFALARDHCGQAIDVGLSTSQAYLLRARSRVRLGEFNLALEDIDKVQQARSPHEIDVLRGDAFCGLCQWNSAIRAYSLAKARGFDSAGLDNNMAFALSKLGQRKGALRWLDRALAVDASLPEAYYQRAQLSAALAEMAGRPTPVQAIADIERAAELWPQNGRIYVAAARILATACKQTGVAETGERAISYVLQSLRFGYTLAEISASGIPTEIVERAQASPQYKLAVEQGATAHRLPPPGLVDALAGAQLD